MSEGAKPVELREVLLSFIRTELAKDHCGLLRPLWQKFQGHAWDIIANIADREKLYVLRKAVEQPELLTEDECRFAARWLGEFGTERKTLIPFTTGSYADTRNLAVSQDWYRMNVPLKALWIKQVNAERTAILARYEHNVVQAIDELRKLPHFKAWDASRDPPPIICLQKAEPDVKGEYWVLDGSHRAIAKSAHDRKADIDAYVGTWGDESKDL